MANGFEKERRSCRLVNHMAPCDSFSFAINIRYILINMNCLLHGLVTLLAC